MTIKFTLGFLLGATLAATIVHYLGTAEGRALVNRVKDDTASLRGQEADEDTLDTVVVVVDPGISSEPAVGRMRESLS